MVREGEKGEFVNLIHTMSNSPIIKTKTSIICLGSHRIYSSRSCGFELWLACGN
ncbi:hypothetical protein L873DRAFT_1813754 [Choiromyces venosus 120613-1]|uniref:Uncharacterized protein n=1 Tax=Choiromyces venosus 120613-1 TaxID=1336337 RepID=A0A3N4JCA6_9PEZI|nr:hypothetical protein L873DRAFT_1813754 [Choiromyces venosus 120613-1]